MTGEENAVSIGLLKKALGEEPAFRTGERVRMSVRFPIGHFRVPNYIRGKRGWIESVIEPPSISNEEEGYGRNAGSKRHHYRVAIPLTELWPQYRGSDNDGPRLDRCGPNHPRLFGLTSAAGMVLVDGLDGYLAAGTQRLAATGDGRRQTASQFLGSIVVTFSFTLGGPELLGMELDRFALPLGLCLFVGVIAIRVWARSKGLTVSTPAAINEMTSVNEI